MLYCRYCYCLCEYFISEDAKAASLQHRTESDRSSVFLTLIIYHFDFVQPQEWNIKENLPSIFHNLLLNEVLALVLLALTIAGNFAVSFELGATQINVTFTTISLSEVSLVMVKTELA